MKAEQVDWPRLVVVAWSEQFSRDEEARGDNVGSDSVGAGLILDHRRIIIDSFAQLQPVAALAQGAAAFSPQLADALTHIVRVVVAGLDHGSSPDQVIADAVTRKAILAHVDLVRRGGLTASQLVDQYQTLRQTTLRSLESQSRNLKISGPDAFQVARRLSAIYDSIIKVAVDAYQE